MATEARGKVHVDDQWVGAHHTVLVKGVVVVVASPSTPDLQGHRMLGFSGRLLVLPALSPGQASAPSATAGWGVDGMGP